METVKVKGMSCNHCKMSVTDTLSKLPGITNVEVDLQKAEASYETDGTTDKAAIKDAITKIGFEAE